jgi:hypothetical protein
VSSLYLVICRLLAFLLLCQSRRDPTLTTTSQLVHCPTKLLAVLATPTGGGVLPLHSNV